MTDDCTDEEKPDDEPEKPVTSVPGYPRWKQEMWGLDRYDDPEDEFFRTGRRVHND